MSLANCGMIAYNIQWMETNSTMCIWWVPWERNSYSYCQKPNSVWIAWNLGKEAQTIFACSHCNFGVTFEPKDQKRNKIASHNLLPLVCRFARRTRTCRLERHFNILIESNWSISENTWKLIFTCQSRKYCFHQAVKPFFLLA